MMLRILVIDDQLAVIKDVQDDFLWAIGELTGAGTSRRRSGRYDVTFCRGQIERDGRISNDVSIALEALGKIEDWALVLLDMQFDSGPVDAVGKAKGDVLRDNFFGLEIEAELLKRFPDLPLVRFTGKREMEIGKADRPYLAKLQLTPSEFTKTLLAYGRLTHNQKRELLQLPEGVCIASPKMLETYVLAMQLAQVDDPVLITGESGTGKEVIAKYMHQISPRSEAPFIPVNVAAMPAQLADAELFGHERNAFTGADRLKRGYFEQTEAGTIFLDEIGDMPQDHQLRLLRVIQERQFRRVGGSVFVPFTGRIVLATHRNLAERIQSGMFRDDLYNRLTLKLEVPPLRERREEILPLADHFLDEYSREVGKQGLTFDDSAKRRLQEHDYPGNVRELAAVIKNVVIETGNNRIIRADMLTIEKEYSTIVKGSPLDVIKPSLTTATVSAPTSEGTALTLANAHTLLTDMNVDSLDSSLLGCKTRLEEAMHELMKRCAVATLNRCRHPVSGKYRMQPAMQLLTGDDNLTATEAKRVFNSILGRKRSASISSEDIESLCEYYGKKNS